MFDIVTDLHLLAETVELECKLAQGQDTGANCQGLLLTYSAILTRTAVVLLGAWRKPAFSIAGLETQAVRSDLFNTLNNPSAVSTNLSAMPMVRRSSTANRSRRCESRRQGATEAGFLRGQPLKYLPSLNDGDRHCDDETVKRMLAEQVEDERDARIPPGFGMEDTTLRACVSTGKCCATRSLTSILEQDDFEFFEESARLAARLADRRAG